MDALIIFYILLFLVAFLYSSVGHGGASGYLALMAIFSITPDIMKPTALLLNLFVSIISFLQFYRGRHFNFKLFLPFALASIPLAFLGGSISIDTLVYKKILGIILLIPIIRFLFFSNIKVKDTKPSNIYLSVIIGALIGFISGLIGIGGGIILSPLLLLLRWSDMKTTAAVSALFIFVNSFSGLAGQLSKGIHFSPDMYSYVAVALAGGICGAYFGAIKFKESTLRLSLSLVLVIASYKLLFSGA